VGFEIEYSAKEAEMGSNAQKGLTHMNKDGNVENGVKVQIINPNSVNIKNTTEECGSWKIKSTVKKRTEYTISPVFGLGNSSLCAGCHLMISFSDNTPSFTITLSVDSFTS
jgi:hypothetical protein